MISPIAIVVPAFNPHLGWEQVLVERFLEISKALPTHQFVLYFINDGSSTNSIANNQLEYIQIHIPHAVIINNATNHGKGYVLRQAIAATTESHVIYTDIDLPFSVHSMKQIVENLPMNDVVFGIKKNEYYEQLPLQRKLVSKILQKLIKILFPSLPVSDTQCGLKGMNQKGKAIFLQTKIDRYLFDLEFILYASKAKLNLKPIPVSLREGIVFGAMNYKILLQESKNLWKILRRK